MKSPVSLRRCLARRLLVVMALLLATGAGQAAERPSPFDAPVLEVRPRIFLRDDNHFEGLTLGKLREHVKSAEFAHLSARDKWRSRPQGRAILWLGDECDYRD